MDFSSKRFNDIDTRYFESDVESDIQIIFIPGLLTPETWKHQIRYFGKNYRTITYRNNQGDYETEKKIVDGILDQSGIKNSILVSANMGNSLLNEFEDREQIIATAATGLKDNYGITLPSSFYNILMAVYQKPKIAKKQFFGSRTDYRVVRNFINEIEKPEYRTFRSFKRNYSFEKPVKNSISIHGEKDRFDSVEFAKEMKPNMKLCRIQNAGSFSFYEKPEEFNKVLSEFIKQLEGFVESRKVGKAREKNYSLKDFETGAEKNSAGDSMKKIGREEQKRAVAKKR